jgi:potassium-dependent mechanosensitive channel
MRLTVALLLVSLLASAAARGQQPLTPPASAAQASMPDLGQGAEEVAAHLRQLTGSLSDTAAFAALEAEVAADTHRAAERWSETGDLLKTNLRPTALDSLESSWQALRSQLDDVMERIDARARRRTADLDTLAKLHESWARALDLAQKADAPAPVLERARSTLAAIDAVRPGIEQRRARVLVLQDSVSRALETCDDARASIDDARRQAIERIFVRQQPPVWRIGLAALAPPRGGLGLGGDLATKIEDLRIYTRAYSLELVLSVLIVLAFVLLLRRGRSRMESSGGLAGGLSRASSVVETPVAAATLLGLLVTRPLRPDPPFALLQMILVIAVTAAVFVLRPVLDARVAPAVYAAAALLVLNLASGLVEMPPALEQVILIVELGATAALLLWTAARLNRLGPDAHSPRLRAIGAAFMRVLALGCGASALAAAAGYLELAEFLGVGLFYTLFVSFVLLAGRVVLEDVVTLGLTRGPATRLHAIERHHALLERRVRRAVDLTVLGLWLWILLGHFDLLAPVGAVLRGALDARLRVGELDLPVARVLGFVAVVIGVYLITRMVMLVLEEDVYSRMTLPRGVPYALSSLTRYGLLLTGFLLALGTLGFDLTRITVLLSALGLGIGFGLQQIVNNFISGLIVLFERPVQVGDSIQLGDLGGDVLRIGIRSSTLQTPQGAEVIVPNSTIIQEKVTNWTLSDRRRRIDLDIGVTGDTDPERIIALLGDIARRDPRVSSDPPPEALLMRFGEASADFQLRFWTDKPDWVRLRSDLGVALQRALRAVRVQDSTPPAAKETTS